MPVANKKGGYDAVFMESSVLATNYECPICTFALRDPVQTKDCGHRYCKHCFEDMCKRYLIFRQDLDVAFRGVFKNRVNIYDEMF